MIELIKMKQIPYLIKDQCFFLDKQVLHRMIEAIQVTCFGISRRPCLCWTLSCRRKITYQLSSYTSELSLLPMIMMLSWKFPFDIFLNKILSDLHKLRTKAEKSEEVWYFEGIKPISNFFIIFLREDFERTKTYKNTQKLGLNLAWSWNLA